MISTFPAIFIGGPPHSGKSTLSYRLSQALHHTKTEFYMFRASPDGEGNWSYEAPPNVVAELRLRAKSDWTPQLAERISRDVARRHLPLLVDVGGKVSPETEQIARQCTHAILIAGDPEKLAPWRELVKQQGLSLLADVESSLDQAQTIVQEKPTLRGIINGLSQDSSSDGVCFDALVQRIRHIFSYDSEELFQKHQVMTDIEMVLHVERAIFPLPAHAKETEHNENTPLSLPAHTGSVRWSFDELPILINSNNLPKDEPLAIYGRGPVWLYAALAAFCYPAAYEVFDVRQGWVKPPTLTKATQDDPARVRWDSIAESFAYVHVQMSPQGGYLDYRDMVGLPVPDVSSGKGLILNGKFPNWLWAALVRTYIDHPWIAVYIPSNQGAVVVYSQTEDMPVGKELENIR